MRYRSLQMKLIGENDIGVLLLTFSKKLNRFFLLFFFGIVKGGFSFLIGNAAIGSRLKEDFDCRLLTAAVLGRADQRRVALLVLHSQIRAFGDEQIQHVLIVIYHGGVDGVTTGAAPGIYVCSFIQESLRSLNIAFLSCLIKLIRIGSMRDVG